VKKKHKYAFFPMEKKRCGDKSICTHSHPFAPIRGAKERTQKKWSGRIILMKVEK
jgi:hypothetical protein